MKKRICIIITLMVILLMTCTACVTKSPNSFHQDSTSNDESETIVEGASPDEDMQESTSKSEEQEITTYDAEMIIESFSSDEIISVPYITEPASDSTDTFDQFQFDGYESGSILSDYQKYVTTENTSKLLDLVRCIWSPEQNTIYIGFYNLNTETGYAYPFSGGDISGVLDFSSLPAGEYIVYIKNMGNETIFDGTMRYRVG